MKANYVWGWQISNEGFSVIMPDDMTFEEQQKRHYVNQFLDPSVSQAWCGWHGIAYVVCTIDGDCRREFVLMFADRNDTPNQARWINVTGCSKGAIAEAVWSLVFA